MGFRKEVDRRLLRISVASLLLCVCHSLTSDESNLLQQCISNFDPTVDYYQKLLPAEVLNQSFVLPIPLDLQEIDTATGFGVTYGNYYKVVENQFFNLTYFVYQCGAPRPNPQMLGLPAEEVWNIFQLPLVNFSTDSTIPLAFLEFLGRLDSLSLASSASDYISSSCVLRYINDGDIAIIPDTGLNTSNVLFAAAQGIPSAYSNAVSFDATFDGGPLMRAEWIKYLATFLNEEDKAENIFHGINKTYQCMNESMSRSASKPIVAWIQFVDGVWSFSNATYKLQLSLDAGGVNLGADILSTTFRLSVASELAAFHHILQQLDVVVDETYAANPYSYTLANFTANAKLEITYSRIPLLVNKQVWRFDKRVGLNNGLDWYESAIPQPHVVLYDLIGMLYPSKGWIQTYFRNIAKNEEPVNVSGLPCTYSFGQQRDVFAITDPEVVECVGGTNSPTNGSSRPAFSPIYLLLSLLFLFWECEA